MDSVLRAIAVYVFVLVLFRLAGRRTFAEMTSFDFVFLLIIAEATQQGLLGSDMSVMNAWIVVTTLVAIDIGLSLAKIRWPRLEHWLDGGPIVILVNGRPLKDRLRASRIDKDDILHAAREAHGLQRLDQIKYAVLETSGGITIIPKKDEAP